MFAFTINLTRARRRGLSENRIGAPTEFRLEGGVVEKRPVYELTPADKCAFISVQVCFDNKNGMEGVL
jgi:hypothetical protein